MASVQDLETRVILLEQKVDFLLNAIPVTLRQNGDGFAAPAKRTNMSELYKIARQRGGGLTMIGEDQLTELVRGAERVGKHEFKAEPPPVAPLEAPEKGTV